MKTYPYAGNGSIAGKRSKLDGRKAAKALLTILALASLIGTLDLCIHHEPDNETVTFSTDCDNDGEITEVKTSALTYFFQFTGENADSVHFDFGDGTSVDAFEVYKTYEEPGTYNILCSATNFMGTRVSGYQLTIEPEDHGFLKGYDDEVLMLAITFVLMLAAYLYKPGKEVF
ncbi:MAG: PKD domain-containing protein [archaeon]|nr:PKD domain-containing protein [archaeon]